MLSNFLNFILFLFPYLGFGDTANSNFTYDFSSPTKEVIKEAIDTIPAYKTNYYISLKKWEAEKIKHDNSYEYTILHQPIMASYSYYYLTTVVKKGVIVKRKFIERREKYHIDEDDPDKRVIIKWTENKRKIGRHDYPAPATIDEMYARCEKMIQENPKDYKITFLAEHNGLLSYCSVISRKPSCGYGYFKIRSFRWLD